MFNYAVTQCYLEKTTISFVWFFLWFVCRLRLITVVFTVDNFKRPCQVVFLSDVCYHIQCAFSDVATFVYGCRFYDQLPFAKVNYFIMFSLFPWK